MPEFQLANAYVEVAGKRLSSDQSKVLQDALRDAAEETSGGQVRTTVISADVPVRVETVTNGQTNAFEPEENGLLLNQQSGIKLKLVGGGYLLLED